jgi:hypothetical protein
MELGGQNMKLKRGLVVIVGLVMFLSSCSAGVDRPQELSVESDAAFVLKGVSNLTQVAQLTGYDSMNTTNEYEVYGTDLGSMFNVGDQTYIVFGDTFGYRTPDKSGAGGADWRSNTLAITQDNDPSDGLTIDKMIIDYGNHAKEILPSIKVDYDEMTKIPTHGIAVGDSLYLYFMSVNHWGAPGSWDANYGGLARSDDQGEHWTILEDVRWPGDSNFIQVSPYKIKVSEELTEIYLWTIPAGRFGGAALMKVDERHIEDLTKYVYFAGMDDSNQPVWAQDMSEAKLVVEDDIGVGELSVIWNPYLERWIMTYLKEGTGIVIREGLSPWGPWSEPITVVSNTEYPGLYGPYMNPKYMEDNGKTIYFTLSLWEPYNVFWMKVSLDKEQLQ